MGKVYAGVNWYPGGLEIGGIYEMLHRRDTYLGAQRSNWDQHSFLWQFRKKGKRQTKLCLNNYIYAIKIKEILRYSISFNMPAECTRCCISTYSAVIVSYMTELKKLIFKIHVLILLCMNNSQQGLCIWYRRKLAVKFHCNSF